MQTLLQIITPPPKELGAQFVWYLIIVYTFFVTSYSIIRQIFTCRWKRVTGRLLKQSISKFATSIADPSMQEYQLDALYEYEVEGKIYRGMICQH